MSRMLKALRQLELAEQLAAPQSAPKEVAALDEAEADAQRQSLSGPIETSAPIEPSPVSAPSGDEPFEPDFTAWNALSKPYDMAAALTFDSFLEEADASRSVEGGLPPVDSVMESAEAVPLDDVLPEPTVATSPLVGENEFPPGEACEVESSLLSTLETAEQLATLAGEHENGGEAFLSHSPLQATQTAAPAEEVFLGEASHIEDEVEHTEDEDSGIDAPLPDESSQELAPAEVELEESTPQPHVENELVEPSGEAIEQAGGESATNDDRTPGETAVEDVQAEVPPAVDAADVVDAVDAAERTDDVQSVPANEALLEEVEAETDTTASEDELPSTPNSDAADEAAITIDPDADEMQWDDLFPDADADSTNTSPGDFEEDLGDAVSDSPGDATPATENGEAATIDATDDHHEIERADSDSNLEEVFDPTSEQESNHAQPAEERPAFSAAEVAASADLQDGELLQQYQALAGRIDDDLGKSEHRCAALIGAEHQPHVTDTILRSAMAACLDESRHVLLIDASLGDKHLTAGLGMSAEFGFSEVLKGRVPWQQAVRATGTPGLCALPAGRITPPTLERNDKRLSDLLKELTSQWDLVLLDAGCCQDSAADCLMAAARNVYLLIRLGETEVEAAKTALDAIAASGAKHRGAIATNA